MAEENGGFTPPYVPFKTLITFLDKMQEKGLPSKLDTSALDSFSGTVQYHLMHALRSLDFIDPSGVVSKELREMVERPEMRPDYLRDALYLHYTPLVELGEQNATAAQMHSWFKSFNISGSTVRKAVRFYLQAAAYTGLTVSPHFRAPSAPKAGSVPRKAKKGTRSKEVQAQVKGADRTPHSEKGGMKSLQTQYIEKLMARGMDDEGEMDPALLDRIERLLGFTEADGEGDERE